MGTAGMSKKVGQTKKLQRFEINGQEYKVGDTVYIKGQGETLPYLGTIKEITERVGPDKPHPDRIICTVSWFYRPEEAAGGRKPFHGEKELFKSDHQDSVHASSIEGECFVHSLAQYQALTSPGEDDFFARFTYLTGKQEFKPARVPVYCRCEMPYNPDLYMICCIGCEEWFHPKCLGMTDEEAAEVSRNFFCESCVKKQSKAVSVKSAEAEQGLPSSVSHADPFPLDDDEEQ